MSVLVVGVTGFLGTEICRRLAGLTTPTRARAGDLRPVARRGAARAGGRDCRRRPGLFHETWLSPATGFDAANGTVRVYGSGEVELSWIALVDVATAAVNALEHPEAEDAVVPLAAERLSYRDVIGIFEQVSGRSLAVEHVPAEALGAQRDTAAAEREQSFAGLMLSLTSGSPAGDGESGCAASASSARSRFATSPHATPLRDLLEAAGAGRHRAAGVFSWRL